MRNKLILGLKYESVYEFIIIYVLPGCQVFLWAEAALMLKEEFKGIHVPFLINSGIDCVVLPL